MRINKSIISWTFSVWLCFALTLQSTHGIDLLIQEIAQDTHHEHKHKSATHHDENCTICHFHLSPSLLPTFSTLQIIATTSHHLINDTYREGFSFYSSEYISLRAPPYKIS